MECKYIYAPCAKKSELEICGPSLKEIVTLTRSDIRYQRTVRIGGAASPKVFI